MCCDVFFFKFAKQKHLLGSGKRGAEDNCAWVHIHFENKDAQCPWDIENAVNKSVFTLLSKVWNSSGRRRETNLQLQDPYSRPIHRAEVTLTSDLPTEEGNPKDNNPPRINKASKYYLCTIILCYNVVSSIIMLQWVFFFSPNSGYVLVEKNSIWSNLWILGHSSLLERFSWWMVNRLIQKQQGREIMIYAE